MADQEQANQQDKNQDQNSPKSEGQSAPPQGGEGGAPSSDGAAGGGAAKQEDSPAKKAGRRVLIFGVILLLILGASFWYWRSTFTEDTDDAQVDGDIYQVSARVTGQVTKVFVEENKPVKKGDLLLEIDPTDYQVALDQAQANLASAQADYVQANVSVPVTGVQTRTTLANSGVDIQVNTTGVDQSEQQALAAQARLEQAQANAIKATKDVERYTPLVEKDVISRQQYDAAVATATAANAAVVEAQKNLTAQQAAVLGATQRLQTSRNQAIQAAKTGPDTVKAQQARAQSMLAAVKQAETRVEQAKLNLSYTRVTAPTDGIVNKKNVDTGGNLSVGQDLLSIVPLNNLWVTANFKETQLNKMHRCQLVELKVDALGGRKFSGKITQVGGATGSRLSLFPPENATGNYVKVVQRIPVRIDFTNLDQENKDFKLRPGFSVTPNVDVKGTGDYKESQNCEAGLPEEQTQPH